MEFIKPNININFIGRKKIAFIISAALIIISIAFLIIQNGPKYGIDFAGGTLIQLRLSSGAEIDDIKKGLNNIDLKKSTVQTFGEKKSNEYLIRTDVSIEDFGDISEKVKYALKDSTGRTVEIRRVEMVGPQVGKDLREKALFALFFALLFITIYISGRFELKWLKSGVTAGIIAFAVYFPSLFNISIPVLITIALAVSLAVFWYLDLSFALGAIIAILHDVIITVGVFSILGKEFTLPIVAALLTIIGYSLNDTIIVFDRIRENLRTSQKQTKEEIINRSINETLSRTILTSTTTLAVVISLFIFGGGIVEDFALAMIIGVTVGTYSSIFIASPILLAWDRKGKKGGRPLL
jgi:preprotein translocase subunit SecF